MRIYGVLPAGGNFFTAHTPTYNMQLGNASLLVLDMALATSHGCRLPQTPNGFDIEDGSQLKAGLGHFQKACAKY